MIQHFCAISIESLKEPEVKKPKLSNDGSFYIIYSPKIKLRWRDSAMLSLRLKVNFRNKIETMIGLLASFVSRKLSNRKLKLDLRQKKRRDNSTRYFKQTLL